MLFLLPRGQTLLVDTGTKAAYASLRAALRQAGVQRIDHLIFTHGHKDHIGGLKQLAADYPIGTIYTAALDTATYSDKETAQIEASARRHKTLREGDVYLFGGIRIEALSPNRAYADAEDDNNNSLVLRLTQGKVSFLLMGDATSVIEARLLEACPAKLPAAFLKAGHHGKEDASADAFVRAVSPQTAYLTGSTAEDADSLSPIVLKRLADAGARIYTNEGEHLAVRFMSDGKTLGAGEYIYQ